MRLRSAITSAVALSVLLAVAPAFAAVPTVTAFSVPASGFSPIPVTAFTASDNDGTVVGYMITTSSSRPSASDPRWTATAWTSFTTTSLGTITLYAWAKDNAAGVSASRNASTSVVGGHNHDTVYVNEGQANSIANAMIVDGAVDSAKIAAGAVSDSKIAGTVADADTVDGKHAAEFAAAIHAHGTADIAGLPAALDAKADAGHDHDALYQQHYANVVVVAKSGSAFSDPIAAINAISDASPSNPYLLKIMPGVYDLGAGTLAMKEYVDIEGAGEFATVITSAVNGYQFGTVDLANNAELRALSVSNTGAGTAIAILASNLSASPKLSHVTAIAAGAGTNIGLYTSQSALVMDNVTTTASGGTSNTGMVSGSSGPLVMSKVVVVASGGAETYGVRGGVVGTLSDLTVTASGDGAVTGIAAGANMNNVTVTVTGGTSATGISFGSGSFNVTNVNVTATAAAGTCTGMSFDIGHPTVTRSTVTATGAAGGNCYGISKGGNTMHMTDVIVTASGGANCYGYYTVQVNSWLTDVSFRAKLGTANYGMYLGWGSGGYVEIDRSSLDGTTNSITMEYMNTVRIASSKLTGAALGASCIMSYNSNYVLLDASCH